MTAPTNREVSAGIFGLSLAVFEAADKLFEQESVEPRGPQEARETSVRRAWFFRGIKAVIDGEIKAEG